MGKEREPERPPDRWTRCNRFLDPLYWFAFVTTADTFMEKTW